MLLDDVAKISKNEGGVQNFSIPYPHEPHDSKTG